MDQKYSNKVFVFHEILSFVQGFKQGTVEKNKGDFQVNLDVRSVKLSGISKNKRTKWLFKKLIFITIKPNKQYKLRLKSRISEKIQLIKYNSVKNAEGFNKPHRM